MYIINIHPVRPFLFLVNYLIYVRLQCLAIGWLVGWLYGWLYGLNTLLTEPRAELNDARNEQPG